MIGGADLHLHTVFSDGTYTPETLVATAQAKNLNAIAITDHDTLDGLERVRAAAGDALEVVPGVEFGTPSRGDTREEAHIVGLFLDPEHDELRQMLSRFRRLRRERAEHIVEKLNRIGVTVRFDDVIRLAGEGNFSRLHVAKALVEAGHISYPSMAFKKWIGAAGPAYVSRERPPADDLIRVIHAAGGLAILAHPGQTKIDPDIPAFVDIGLDGIEVYCPDHSAQQVRHYRDIAAHHRLLVSAGSDCHGHNKDRRTIGTVRLPDTDFAALRERATNGRST